jgi:hypothetical protein
VSKGEKRSYRPEDRGGQTIETSRVQHANSLTPRADDPAVLLPVI